MRVRVWGGLSCAPPAATCWDAAGPGWIKLGLAAAPERAELCRARLGAAGRVSGTGAYGWVPVGIWAPRDPLPSHVACACPSRMWGVPCLQGKSSFSPAQPVGPLGAGPAPAPSLEGVMCQHRARDKDSDCICV